MKLHKLISTVDMSHEEWLRYRKLGIGGSDAGSICGLNPYSSAIAVFQDKTQKEAGEKEDNEAMRQGRDLEEYVARRFMEETGKKVRRANAIYGHPDHDFMMANVDRLVVGENAGLECKTASAYSAERRAYPGILRDPVPPLHGSDRGGCLVYCLRGAGKRIYLAKNRTR